MHPDLDHPELSARFFYPWANRFVEPFFVEGDGFRPACRYLKVDEQFPTVIHFSALESFIKRIQRNAL